MYTDIIPHRSLPFGSGKITFSVPEKLKPNIHVGQIVEILLRGRREQGCIIDIFQKHPDFDTVDILRILTPQILSKKSIDFLEQITEYYFSSYSKALFLMIPEKMWKSDGIPPTESYLVKTRFIASPRGTKQKLIFEILEKNSGKMPEKNLREMAQASSAVITNLLEKGLMRRTLEEFITPKIPENFNAFPEFTKDQKKIFTEMKSSKKSLLMGPAGSGKTLLALKHVADEILKGKQALFLVPEKFISASLIELFSRFFPREIFELYHSGLSEGEKWNIWWKVKTGRLKIIFGTRAALFLPFENLGIVVVDEEHDTSYKNDQAPRYHVRKAAEMLAEIHDAQLILQSATPSLEAYYLTNTIFHSGRDKAMPCLYKLFTLEKRFGSDFPPKINIVDLREELQRKNFSPFSLLLQKKIHECLQKKKQVLLFLNRRGKNSALVCRECGISVTCSNCKNRITIHEDRNKNEFLLCHHCGQMDKIPFSCSRCNSTKLKGFGVGTQELEKEAKKLFPHAKILRADSDSTARKNASEFLLEEFSSGKADILIGTQIIGKGIDIPNIGLVGILLADIAFHLPDFRASEYAFQMLSQVAGRTGRKGEEGETVLQTYLPEHPAVQFCGKHNFQEFYDQEMMERKSLSFPPFTKSIRLIFVDYSEKKAKEKSEKWKVRLVKKWHSLFPKEHFFISLAPAMTKKQHDKFHYHIFIMGNHPEWLLNAENLSGIRIDRDPVDSF
ncbi:primosomal protein N' [Candidatus Peregrinibacteria bacterium]|nr:primosomal protein N' [Candidatus Peregrinibacteria bacterium]